MLHSGVLRILTTLLSGAAGENLYTIWTTAIWDFSIQYNRLSCFKNCRFFRAPALIPKWQVRCPKLRQTPKTFVLGKNTPISPGLYHLVKCIISCALIFWNTLEYSYGVKIFAIRDKFITVERIGIELWFSKKKKNLKTYGTIDKSNYNCDLKILTHFSLFAVW